MVLTASSALGSHPAWHLAIGLVIVVVMSVVPALWARHRASAGHRGTRRVKAGWPLRIVAAGSLAAGAVHVSVCPEHFRESTLFGVFFVVAALAQVSWAGILLRHPTRRWLQVGAVGQAAVAWLWLVSRTVGVPFGPSPWRREEIGINGVLTTVVELAVAVVAVWLATSTDRVAEPRPRHHRPLPPGLTGFQRGG